MRYAALAVCAVLVSCAHVPGGPSPVERDRETYAQEIIFWRMAAIQSAERLGDLIMAHCECKGQPPFEQFATRECHEAASLAVLLVSRADYHANMMEFLGGLREHEPEQPPPIQPNTDLCQ